MYDLNSVQYAALQQVELFLYKYASVQKQVTFKQVGSEHVKIVTEIWLQEKTPDSAITPGSFVLVQCEQMEVNTAAREVGEAGLFFAVLLGIASANINMVQTVNQ